MRICLVAEGSYPYIVGGVSSWVHNIITVFPEIEFMLMNIVPDRSYRGNFVYDLPPNVISVREVYLQDYDWDSRKGDFRRHRVAMTKEEYKVFQNLILGDSVDWFGLFNFFRDRRFSVNDLLMSSQFLELVKMYSHERQANVNFVDCLWTMRSIFLPLFMVLKCEPPVADLYHCVSTGYAGIVGSLAKHLHPGSAMIISEHGIYTREREEEIIRAKWIEGVYKDVWINQFRQMARCAYNSADLVISLFERAKQLQIELGCVGKEMQVIPNGINPHMFSDLPPRDPNDSHTNIGAFVRVTPIKDIKTMINAFHYAQEKVPNIRLWIMGPIDEEPQYFQECKDLVDSLQAKNIEFTGRIKTQEYMGKMDITILTSISEGQPLTILESFAAKKPCIATNVGNCKGLIYGETDDYGAAGIVTPVLNIREITNAIVKLASNKNMRKQMGEIGYKRLLTKYTEENLINNYRAVYTRFAAR